MRPKSAANRILKKRQKQSASTSKKKQIYNSSFCSVSKVSSRYTSNSHTWQIKTQKLKVCNEAKSIALIHAYQPKKLKQCLITDPKVYQKFYNNVGKCQLANLYTKSFMAHFRQWRRSIRERITNIISMLVQHRKQVNPEQVQLVLVQLQQITSQLKKSTQVVFNNKNIQSSNEARQLHQNFQHMQAYIKHLVEIVRCLCQYTKQINALLQEGAQKGEQGIKIIQRKVKKLHKQYDRKILQSLHFCSTHPESNFMNRTQYKIKLKFDSIAKDAIETLQNIFKLTNIISKFEDKLAELNYSKNRPEQFTVDSLNQIVSLLNTYEESNTKENQYNNQQDQNVISKSQQILIKLRTRIKQISQQIISIYKDRAQLIVQYQYKEIKQQKVVGSMKDFANRYKICKKKLLLLSKIFNKRNYPQFYELLSHTIKESSQNFQKIFQIIQKLISKTHDKKNHYRDKVCSIIQYILPLVLQYQQNRDKICQNLLKIYTQTPPSQLFQKQEITIKEYSQKQSKVLKQFLEIMRFSQFQVKQLISVPRYDYKTKDIQEIIKLDQVQKVIESNVQQLYRLEHQVFQKGQSSSITLNKLMNNQLILKFLSFSDDIMRQPIHSFQVFRQFYRRFYGLQTKNKKIKKQQINSLVQYFEEVMSKCSAYKNEKQAKKFIQWMFQNRMAMYVLQNMKKVKQLLDLPLNKQYWSRSIKLEKNKLCYRMNNQVKEYFMQKQELLKQILSNSSKYVKEKSLFDYFFLQSLHVISQMIQKQQIYQQYDNSIQTGKYWPTSKFLCDWTNLQFSFFITKDVDHAKIKEKRSQVVKQLMGCIYKLGKLIEGDKQKRMYGQKFVQSCNSRIKNIKQYLLNIAKFEPKDNQIERSISKYNQISKSIIQYMIMYKMYHAGVFTNNQQPLLLIAHCDSHNYQLLLQLLQKRLKLDPLSIERKQAKNKFIPFQLKNIIKIDTNDKNGQPQFILQPKKGDINEKNKNQYEQQIFQQQIQQEKIQDQVYQEQIDDNIDIVQSIIESSPPKKNPKKTNEAKFLLSNKNSVSQINSLSPSFVLKNQSSKLNQSQQQKIPQGYRDVVYYKIKQLESLQKVRQCIKAAQFEHQLIKNELKIQILALAFDVQQPNPELVQHLNHIIAKASHNNFLQLLNKQQKLSKNQQIVDKLKNFLVNQIKKQGAKDRKQGILKQVFQFLNYKYRYLLNQSEQLNRIILCQIDKNNYYVYLCLSNNSPFQKQNQLLKDDDVVKVQYLFLKSLFQLPFVKNKNLDQVRKQTQKLNSSIKMGYQKLKQSLEQYKKYPAQNKSVIDKKVEKYIQDKTNNYATFTLQNTIDYSSYQLFMAQYEQISSNKNQKLVRVLADNNLKLPLFCSSNQQQIKKVIEATNNKEGFSILPEKYNNSNLVERNAVDTINIKYKYIVNQLISKQLNNCRPLDLCQIFSMLYGSTFDKQKQKEVDRHRKKIIDVVDSKDVNDYRTVGNVYKTIGQPQKIIEKLNELQCQKEILDKISSIQKQNAKFILEDTLAEADKQLEYMQPVEQAVSFILQKQIPRVQIQPHLLEQFHNLLNKIGIQHKMIKHKGAIIGLCQPNKESVIAIKQCLNINQVDNVKYKQIGKNQIQLEQLFIYLVFSKRIEQSFQVGKQNVGRQVADSFTIQISNQTNNQTIVNVLKLQSKPAIVLCKYPKKPIQIKLKRKNGQGKTSRSVEVLSFTTKYYQYGSKYNLTAIQNQILKEIIKQYQRVKEQQDRLREQEERKKQLQIERKRKQQQEEKRKIQQQNKRIQQEKKRIQQEKRRVQQEEKKRKEQEQRAKRQMEKKIEQQILKQAHDQNKIKVSELDKKKKKKIIKNREDPRQVLEISFTYSQGDKPQMVNFINKNEEKILDVSDEWADQVSITLSDNAQIERQNLIQNNLDYHFLNVKQLISKNNPAMFILQQ